MPRGPGASDSNDGAFGPETSNTCWMITTETSHCLARSGPDRTRWSGLNGSIERAKSSDLYIPGTGKSPLRSNKIAQDSQASAPCNSLIEVIVGGTTCPRRPAGPSTQSPRSASCVGAPDCLRSASGGTDRLSAQPATNTRRHVRRAGLGTARRIAGMAIRHRRGPWLNTTGPWSWQPAGRSWPPASPGRSPCGRADDLVERCRPRSPW